MSQNQSNSVVGHTPGPWEIDNLDFEGNIVARIVRGGERLRNPEKPTGYNELPPAICTLSESQPFNQEANASLIAAAPELLAACKSAVRHAEQMIGPEGFAVLTDLESAIARAEGRTAP